MAKIGASTVDTLTVVFPDMTAAQGWITPLWLSWIRCKDDAADTTIKAPLRSPAPG
ncbi:MAG: hypothetical protein GX885_08385 [Methanomicrobiales archaeon]|nr:hypothetical protein [Methanomicrobiales archaeon]